MVRVESWRDYGIIVEDIRAWEEDHLKGLWEAPSQRIQMLKVSTRAYVHSSDFDADYHESLSPYPTVLKQ